MATQLCSRMDFGQRLVSAQPCQRPVAFPIDLSLWVSMSSFMVAETGSSSLGLINSKKSYLCCSLYFNTFIVCPWLAPVSRVLFLSLPTDEDTEAHGWVIGDPVLEEQTAFNSTCSL